MILYNAHVSSALLNVSDLTVRFRTASGFAEAVRNVSLSIAPGEVLGVVGESGSGKSATSLAIMRLLVPQAQVQGSIEFQGRNLLEIPEAEMRAIRGSQISMIFQEPMTALNPLMRAGDQIAEALLAHQKISRGARGNARFRPCVMSKFQSRNRGLATIRISSPEASVNG